MDLLPLMTRTHPPLPFDIADPCTAGDDGGSYAEVDFVSIIFPEYRVRRERSAPDEAALEPARAGERSDAWGHRPDMEAAAPPLCPDCRHPMTPIGQIDSPDEDYGFGDAGRLCLFHCPLCHVATALEQLD